MMTIIMFPIFKKKKKIKIKRAFYLTTGGKVDIYVCVCIYIYIEREREREREMTKTSNLSLSIY